MNNNSDPEYDRYASMDFRNAKPVAEIPALARLQAEQRQSIDVTITLDPATLAALRERAERDGTAFDALVGEAVKQFVAGQTLADIVRETLREELRSR
ncbi:MAG: hypothetical protein N838_14765 [Thiohalocapsa sp. PB-PSB1]|jgi:hypothetical protein|nr:MAG: hypothetical protein N838_14765 [Thiohalocapsa sp. PB-PSB1]HCS88475.1 hypothetical protein [Chromatiaceae bacterium]